MSIMLVAVLGLFLGSFVNALVFRLHEQSGKSRKSIKSKVHKAGQAKDLSIVKGRSMCPNCGHTLSAADLAPVFSWLFLRGKCRYCQKPISWQYPLVELVTAGLFVVSYLFWPGDVSPISSSQSSVNFIVWLISLTGFVALLVYDLRWMLLPNRIVYPLIALAGLLAVYNAALATEPLKAVIYTAVSVLIAGGLFWGLFELSKGKWIGGGDVKLGFLIGLLLADPYGALFMLMVASLIGTIVVLPGLVLRKLSTTSRVPFGPFLIVACIVVYLFGASVINWYKKSLYFGG